MFAKTGCGVTVTCLTWDQVTPGSNPGAPTIYWVRSLFTMSKKFKKNKEDFVCEHCGAEVVGDGYTNHCPTCLWSKHVDVNPGDREATCQGMMKPALVEVEKQEYILTNVCEKCGHKKRNKISTRDNFDEVVKIARIVASRGK